MLCFGIIKSSIVMMVIIDNLHQKPVLEILHYHTIFITKQQSNTKCMLQLGFSRSCTLLFFPVNCDFRVS